MPKYENRVEEEAKCGNFILLLQEEEKEIYVQDHLKI